MGSKSSRSNSGGKTIKVSNPKINNSQNINNLDISAPTFDNSLENTPNYKGISYKAQIQKSDNYNSDQVTQEKTFSDNNSGLFFNIRWKAGGNHVKIAGAFSSWKIINLLFSKKIKKILKEEMGIDMKKNSSKKNFF